MKVTKISVFPVNGNSKLKAKCNVSLSFENDWEVSIKGLRIHDDGVLAPWVGVPTEKYEKNGATQYAEMLWLNQKVQSDLYPKIIAEYRKHN